MNKALLLVGLLCAVLLLAVGCQKQEPEQKQEAAETTPPTPTPPPAEESALVPAEAKPQFTRAGVDSITFKTGEKPRVKMETTLGTIVLELWPDVAPLHCKNLLYLAKNGFYDSLKIHRVISGFVLQSGCPIGNGTGGPGYNIEAEFSDNKHVKGSLSMARSQDVNSAGSQFFVCLAPAPALDSKYTVFGQTVEGMDVIDKFNEVETKNSPSGEKSSPVEPLYLVKVTLLTE